MTTTVATFYDQPEEHNYDAAVDDFRRDLSLSPRKETDHFSTTLAQVKDIDEEVKVGKKRRPVPKLDAERMLSDRGVPELRRRVTKRLRFHGKGHEYSDMTQLLNMYQMWLDDLYPRAKFRDGLSLIERVGHTKRLQVMRKTWIQATRPVQTLEEDELAEQERAEQPLDESTAVSEHQKVDTDTASGVEARRAQETAADSGGLADEVDDLDALMAEEANAAGNKTVDGERLYQDRDDRFADEEEAMADMGDLW